MSKPRLIVCADDYAFTPGVSRGIRELLAARRISATSVMAGTEFWPVEAPALKAVAGDADIGLHLTLTDQRAMGQMPIFAPEGSFPSMAAVYKMGLRRQLPLAEIRIEAERQLEAFIKHWGAPPAHIDGHHHTQQLPGVRDIVIDMAARIGSRTWVRAGAESWSRIWSRGVARRKAMLIGSLGTTVSRIARGKHVPTNCGFSGAYDFLNERRPVSELFPRFIAGAGDNMLVMCHPGYADDLLASLDIMTTPREAELHYLMSDAWPAAIAGAGLELGPLRRAA